jgi:ATP-dependent helicase HrpB
VQWSTRESAVIARRTVALDQLIVEENPWPEVPAEEALRAMLAGVRELGIDALPWERETRELQARIEFVRNAAAGDATAEAAWPDVSDAALTHTLDAWLAPWLLGITRREQLGRVELGEALRAQLNWQQRRELEEWAPTHLTLPGGMRVRVDYGADGAPAVSVRLQQVFGLAATPRLGRARIPVTFRLLSPAQRPLQVTRDLESFWRGAYIEVRKEMRGRYPKHYWPENPLEAAPVRGIRRKR